MLHGKSSDANAHGVAISQYKSCAIIATYNLQDVWNFNETRLYYKAPFKTLNISRS